MASDAHSHPQDLGQHLPGAETERRSLGIACAASSCKAEEFLYHETLSAEAKRDGAAPLFLCFAVHPQLPSYVKNLPPCRQDAKIEEQSDNTTLPPAPSCLCERKKEEFQDGLDLLASLAAEGRIAAVGESGFDLYSSEYKETEKIQDELFAAHLEIALRHDLPLILHVRRAMHKIFPFTNGLKKLPAVIFHSWPGVSEEGFSLLRKGISAFFSFGTTLLLNHKNAVSSCAAFPENRLLLETDAPWQPLRGRKFSRWSDLPAITAAAAAIRKEAGATKGTETAELEEITDSNFYKIFVR